MNFYKELMNIDRIFENIQDNFTFKRVLLGEEIKEIIKNEINKDYYFSINILLDNKKISINDLEDKIEYVYIGVSDVIQNYYSSELCEINYYLFKFETINS